MYVNVLPAFIICIFVHNYLRDIFYKNQTNPGSDPLRFGWNSDYLFIFIQKDT